MNKKKREKKKKKKCEKKKKETYKYKPTSVPFSKLASEVRETRSWSGNDDDFCLSPKIKREKKLGMVSEQDIWTWQRVKGREAQGAGCTRLVRKQKHRCFVMIKGIFRDASVSFFKLVTY